jgi:hypothetical protein
VVFFSCSHRSQTAKAALFGSSSPIKSQSRRRAHEGFRNVFKDDDSVFEDKSSSMSLIESQTSLSDSDGNDSEEESTDEEDSPRYPHSPLLPLPPHALLLRYTVVP